MASDENLYNYYKPNKIVAIVFAAFFLAASALHTWKIVSTRQWFGIAIVIGGMCMYPNLRSIQQAFGKLINSLYEQLKLWVLQHELSDMIIWTRFHHTLCKWF